MCKASQELLETAAKTVNEHAVLNYVDGLIQAMDSSNRAGTIAGALDFISRLAETSPHGVSCNLVRLMPVVTGLVNDASSVVAEAARTTVEKVCHTIDNRDIEPFIDDMVAGDHRPRQDGRMRSKVGVDDVRANRYCGAVGVDFANSFVGFQGENDIDETHVRGDFEQHE